MKNDPILGDIHLFCDSGHSMADREGGLMKTRGFLYSLAKFLGDIQAVRKGKVGKRIIRRGAGKITGKGFRKLFK